MHSPPDSAVRVTATVGAKSSGTLDQPRRMLPPSGTSREDAGLGRLLTRLLHLGRKEAKLPARRDQHGEDYRAVSIVPHAGSCAEARRLRQIRYLTSEVPRLPLPQCSQPLECTCSYRKYPDRRTAERRDIGSTARWYMGLDRRKSSGRRSTDHPLSRIEISWPHRE
jgi:hypothetical protein